MSTASRLGRSPPGSWSLVERIIKLICGLLASLMLYWYVDPVNCKKIDESVDLCLISIIRVFLPIDVLSCPAEDIVGLVCRGYT